MGRVSHPKLNIGVSKRCLSPERATLEKRSRRAVVRTRVDLGRSWDINPFREEPPAYAGETDSEISAVRTAALLDLCLSRGEREQEKGPGGVELQG